MVRRLVPSARPWWWAGLAVLSLVVMAAFSASAQAPGPSDLGKIFKDNDRNSDRTLDREEFHRMIVEAFFFRDRDKNGYLVIARLTGMVTAGSPCKNTLTPSSRISIPPIAIRTACSPTRRSRFTSAPRAAE